MSNFRALQIGIGRDAKVVVDDTPQNFGLIPAVIAEPVIKMRRIDDEFTRGLTNPSPPVAPPVPAVPEFKALANAAGVQIGVGDLTVARPSSAYVFDGTHFVEHPANDPLWSDDSWLKYYPAAINSALHSRNLTDPIWIKQNAPTILQNQIGLTGEANTATFINSEKSDGPEAVTQQVTIVEEAGEHCYSVYIKRDTDETRFPGIQTRLGGAAGIVVILNTKTGDYNILGGPYGEKHRVTQWGVWWKVTISLNKTNAATLFGVKIYPAYSVDGTDYSGTATGSCVVGQTDINLNTNMPVALAIPPIFTTSSAGVLDRTAYSFDLANADTEGGVWAFDLKIDGNYGEDASSSNAGLVSTTNKSEPVFMGVDDLIQTYAGSYTNVDFPYVSGQVLSVSLVYHKAEGKTQLAVNGIAVEGLYTTFREGLGQVALFSDSDRASSMRNLRRYDIATFQDGLDLVANDFHLIT